ncbi:MAG: hypothetical protein M3083_10515 [Actinomycetota bacterium]|nr:hypothetical protein [Actinomycetota bacterium]
MTDLNTTYGIYLVLWPDQETWTLDDPRRAQAERQSATALQLLDHAARNLRATGWLVLLQHLDISYRRPAPNPRGR